MYVEKYKNITVPTSERRNGAIKRNVFLTNVFFSNAPHVNDNGSIDFKFGTATTGINPNKIKNKLFKSENFETNCPFTLTFDL